MNRRIRRVGRYVEALVRDRRPPRGGQDPEDLQALATAIDLSASRPQAGMPDPRFVERLEARLREQTQGEFPVRHREFSRRSLFQAGGLAAAGVAAGVLGDRLVTGSETPARQNLAVDGGSWQAVAAVDEIPAGGAKRFSTGNVEGVVVEQNGTYTAMSAVCTHLGCILALDASRRRLDCPCHRAAFGLDGEVLYHEMPQRPRPLPTIPARVRDGQVEVHVV